MVSVVQLHSRDAQVEGALEIERRVRQPGPVVHGEPPGRDTPRGEHGRVCGNGDKRTPADGDQTHIAPRRLQQRGRRFRPHRRDDDEIRRPLIEGIDRDDELLHRAMVLLCSELTRKGQRHGNRRRPARSERVLGSHPRKSKLLFHHPCPEWLRRQF